MIFAGAVRLLITSAHRWLPLTFLVAQGVAQAQTCQPDKLYDIITSSFHQSAAQRTDGSWAGWGATMGPLGTTGATGSGNTYVYTGKSVGRPLDIIDGGSWASGANRLDGSAPLLMTVGSNSTSEQTIALTTKGLYAWGVTGTVLSTAIKNSATAGSVTVNGNANGLPPNVAPDDVAQIFATSTLLVLVTKLDKGGEAWVLVNGTGGSLVNLRGDGTPAGTDNNAWHRVRTNAAGNPVLKNVLAVRGQVGSNALGALMAHTSDGKLYAWGMTPYFGDGNGATGASYATPMTLPQESGADITPKMIGVTGNTNAGGNTMFVLSTTGTLYSVGNNNQYQLGAGLTTGSEKTWKTVQIGTGNGPGTSLAGNVASFSVQDHDSGSTGGAAGALITADDGTVYTWGNNSGSMIGAPGGAGPNHVAKPNYVAGEQKARLVEVGGHTTVFLPKSSPQFCYVGHQINGSMGDGVITSATQTAFNCSATPVLNICGASGFDYGDAPKGYESGGGANQAMHFYANGGDDPNNNPLFLGDKAPQQNDANPKNVVSGTSNVGEHGDYIPGPPVVLEEDGIIQATDSTGSLAAVTTPGDELPAILDATTSYSLKVKYTNTTLDSTSTPVAGDIHAWVDWNNNGIFETSEYAGAVAVANTTGGVATLTWNGLAGLDEGYRYIRLRITTKTSSDPNFNAQFPAANVVVRPGEDPRALGFAMDGEIEDHRVRVVKDNGLPNVPPVAVDVTTAPVGLSAVPQRLLLPGTTNPAPMNGTDSNGTVVAYRIMTLPANGTLYYLDGVLPVAITSIPPEGLPVEANTELWFASTDPAPSSFTFKAIDNDGDESLNTATYTIPKALIDAVNDLVVASIGTPTVATNVVGNDQSALYGPDGLPINPPPAFVVTSNTNGAKGTVACDPAGTCTYTPSNPNLAGSDTYDYTICLVSNPKICDTATVTVTLQFLTIAPANDVTNTSPGTPVAIPVLNNDRGDAPLDPASVTAAGTTTTPTKGAVDCTTTPGVCIYTPDPGQTGTDTFTYKVCLQAPNGAICKEATVTVNISSAGLVATDDFTNTPQDQTKTIPVLPNDTPVGGGVIDPASVAKTSDPPNGSVNCAAGACTYVPNPGFTGTDHFTYKVCLAAPNQAVCDEAQVTVQVSPTSGGVGGVTSTLTANDDLASTTPGTAVNVPVTGNDGAAGGTIDPVSVLATSGPAHGAVDCATTPGICRYTPTPGFTGDDSFTYKVCLAAPNNLVCDEATVKVHVAAAAAVSAASIPTLGEWGLVILSALVGLLALGMRRRGFSA